MRTWAVILFVLLALASCSKEDQVFSTQESRIEAYIQSAMSSDSTVVLVSNGGVSRLIVGQGTGEQLEKNGSLRFYYAGFVFTGSALGRTNLFATNNEAVAQQYGWSLSTENSFEILSADLSENELVKGLRLGLEGVRAGEECVILFSGKYGFGKRNLGTIPAYSALAYYIWVESVENK